jgi:hypothetical protein
MYINPALVTMCCAMLTAFVLVGGLLWKLAGRLTAIDLNLKIFGKQLNDHIEKCPPSFQRSGD